MNCRISCYDEFVAWGLLVSTVDMWVYLLWVLDLCWIEVDFLGGSAKFVNFTIDCMGSRANVGDFVV